MWLEIWNRCLLLIVQPALWLRNKQRAGENDLSSSSSSSFWWGQEIKIGCTALRSSTSHTLCFGKGSKNNTLRWMAKENTEEISDASRRATPIHHAHSCCPPNFFWFFLCLWSFSLFHLLLSTRWRAPCFYHLNLEFRQGVDKELEGEKKLTRFI